MYKCFRLSSFFFFVCTESGLTSALLSMRFRSLHLFTLGHNWLNFSLKVIILKILILFSLLLVVSVFPSRDSTGKDRCMYWTWCGRPKSVHVCFSCDAQGNIGSWVQYYHVGKHCWLSSLRCHYTSCLTDGSLSLEPSPKIPFWHRIWGGLWMTISVIRHSQPLHVMIGQLCGGEKKKQDLRCMLDTTISITSDVYII